jgi:hypothetical protein
MDEQKIGEFEISGGPPLSKNNLDVTGTCTGSNPRPANGIGTNFCATGEAAGSWASKNRARHGCYDIVTNENSPNCSS